MQFGGDSFTFILLRSDELQRKRLLHGLGALKPCNSKTPGDDNDCGTGDEGKGLEPPRKVKRRENGKCKRCFLGARETVAVLRNHMEFVIAGWQVRVESSAARTGLYPSAIERFNPITEVQLSWPDETGR